MMFRILTLRMNKIELEIKWDENTIKDIAEKLEQLSNTNMVTKEEVLHNLVAKGLIKNKLIAVAGQKFFEY